MNKTLKKILITMFIIMGIGIVFIIMYFVKSSANLKHDARNNEACKTNERLFDYADKLTDSQESTIRADIEAIQEKVGMDFVIFIVDSSTDLSDIGMYIGDSWQLASDLCDYYRFGWEAWPQGSYLDGYDTSTSVVIVANWDTGDLGYSTGGKARDRISNSKAQKIVDYGCKILRDDPVGGFERMISKTQKAMAGSGHGINFLSPFICFVVSLVLSIIFFCINYSKKAGKDTTTASTYSDGNAQIIDRRDIFIRKEVHSVKIQSSSDSSGGSGGGGGEHGGASGHF